MRFDQPLIEGTLIRRQRKFVADVLLATGEEVSVHLANPGSLMGCAEPGSKVLVSKQINPRIKFEHQLEIIYAGRTPVGIHAGRPAAVMAEAISQAKVPELAGYAELTRDTNQHRKCRIDLVVRGNGLRPCYLKAESVTLSNEGVAYFPDAVYSNSAEVMSELTNLVREGNRVMVVMLAQRADVNTFKLADHIDPEFCQVFRDAVARGVETTCYRSRVTRRGIELDQRLDMDLSEP